MNWTEIHPYSDDLTQTLWICGIYKVRTYDGVHFHAYYIKDTDKNWGWNPSHPPVNSDRAYPSPYWSSLESAQQACTEHAQSYIPKPKTVTRAAELLTVFLQEAAA